MAKQTIAVKPAKSVEKRTANGIRKTKYTKAVHKKIVDFVRKGNSVTDAGLRSGLGKDLIWYWLECGKKQPERYPEYAQLVADIEQARAEMRGDIVDNIVTVGTSGAPGTWQAGAWYLERTDPENWGRKDKVEHTGERAGPQTQINAMVLIDTDAREAARDLLKRVAGNAGADIAIGPGSGVQLENGPGS